MMKKQIIILLNKLINIIKLLIRFNLKNYKKYTFYYFYVNLPHILSTKINKKVTPHHSSVIRRIIN